MQMIEFLDTARYIVDLYEQSNSLVLFGPDYRQLLNLGNVLGELPLPPVEIRYQAIVRGIARAEELRGHPHARQVLTALGLEDLLDNNFFLAMSEVLFGLKKDEDVRAYYLGLWRTLGNGWHCLVHIVEPLSLLIIPEGVRKEEDFDQVLTLILNTQNVSVEELIAALQNINGVYQALSRIYAHGEHEQLKLIYSDTGSLRLDFTGLGEPIKQFKNLVMEGWDKVIHRKADIATGKFNAVMAGAKALEDLNDLKTSGALTAEEAQQTRSLLLKNLHGLLDAKATLREAPLVSMTSEEVALPSGHTVHALMPGPTDTDPGDSTGDRDDAPESTIQEAFFTVTPAQALPASAPLAQTARQKSPRPRSTRPKPATSKTPSGKKSTQKPAAKKPSAVKKGSKKS